MIQLWDDMSYWHLCARMMRVPRPTCDLLGGDVLHPRPAAGRSCRRCRGLRFGDLEAGRPSKTGGGNDTVFVGLYDRGWVARVLAAVAAKCGEDTLLVDFNIVACERKFAKSVRALGLTSLRATPHSLRHAGPSNDMFEARVELRAV